MKISDRPKPSKQTVNGGRGVISPDQGGTILSVADASSVDASIEAKGIGQRIRKLRLKRSMGLVELGKQTGLSASFLSQLETGRVIPTLRNLARISLVFGKDLNHFFDANDPHAHRVFRIQRNKDRVRLPIGSPTTDYI